MAYANLHLRLFNQLIGELGAQYHEASLKFNVPESVLEVLYTLCMEEGGCTIGAIIDQTGMSKQTLNSALRRLEAEGNIYLAADGGRRKRVCLTDAGKALAECTAGRVVEIENRIFDTWTPQERETYIALTRRYTEAFGKGIREIK